MAQVPVRTISNLDEVAEVLDDLGIDTVQNCNQVEFLVHERTPLVDAMKIKMRTFPGRDGCRVLNPELLNCKFDAKTEIDSAYEVFVTESMHQCDQELAPIEAHIAELKRLLLLPDHEIENMGPNLNRRNRGVWHVLYPRPLFPQYPPYEYHPVPQARMEYQPAYHTNEDRTNARNRDRRAQKALWRFNLDMLEAKKTILEQKRVNLERALKSVKKKAEEEASHLGAGYANYNFRHL